MRYREIIGEKTHLGDAFWRWFGDSKVVDEAGRPLRMYHGTSHPHIRRFEVGYNSFGNKDFAGSHKVISFSTDPQFANRYSGTPEHGRSPILYPVYIRSINPGDFRNPEHVRLNKQYRMEGWEKWLVSAKAKFPHVWTDERVAKERADFVRELDLFVDHGAWQKWESREMWKAMGWDGAWTREDPHHPYKDALNFAVADGRQVKSATGNRGTFDPDNPDLTEARRR